MPRSNHDSTPGSYRAFVLNILTKMDVEEDSKRETRTFNPRLAPREPLFEVSDVPAFTSASEYEIFRSSLLGFFKCEFDPAPHEYGRALRQILSSFKDPAVRARTQGLIVNPLIHPDWVITYNAFLAALDARFQSPTILGDTRRKWMECKPRKNEKPHIFFIRFEGATDKLIQIQTRLGVPPESNMVIVNRLLKVLPRYLVDYVRLKFLLQQPPLMIELQTLKELRFQFGIAWTYLPKPHTPEDKRSVYTRNTASNGHRNDGTATNEINPPQCSLIVSYDSAPHVPKVVHDRKLILPPDTIGWSVPELLQECPRSKHFLLYRCACNSELLDLPRSRRPAKSCHHSRIVFTDGACTNNGRPEAKAGVGVAYGNDDGSQLSKPITDMFDNFPLRSNQRAELCAAKLGVELLAEAHTKEPESEAEAWIIATNSQYVVKGMTEWLPTWRVRLN